MVCQKVVACGNVEMAGVLFSTISLFKADPSFFYEPERHEIKGEKREGE